MEFPKVTRNRLEKMAVGESVVFQEGPTKNVGAPTQTLAIRAGVKVSTRACFILIPTSEVLTKAVCVTRLK